MSVKSAAAIRSWITFQNQFIAVASIGTRCGFLISSKIWWFGLCAPFSQPTKSSSEIVGSSTVYTVALLSCSSKGSFASLYLFSTISFKSFLFTYSHFPQVCYLTIARAQSILVTRTDHICQIGKISHQRKKHQHLQFPRHVTASPKTRSGALCRGLDIS